MPPKHSSIKLLLTSEWDYSPLAYFFAQLLGDFVLIGMPAPESSNALLFPLAGHEFGHSIWAREKLVDEFSSIVEDKIIDLIVKEPKQFEAFKVASGFHAATESEIRTNQDISDFYDVSIGWALSQAEETFCDLIGLRLFGKSYLNSFSYLLSPSLPTPRSKLYPPISRRASNLVKATARYVVEPPDEFAESFDQEAELELSPVDTYRLKLAESALEEVFDDLMNSASLHAGTHGDNCWWSKDRIDYILSRFRLGVPAEGTVGLPDILNAAWEATKDNRYCSDNSKFQAKMSRFLNELVLKNIQIYEIEQRYKEYEQ